MMLPVVLTLLLGSLVEVHCQPAPYVTFKGNTIPNHGYVNLGLVGDDPSGSNNVLQCHTDLNTCCRNMDGSHRGDWYFPNGTRLQFNSPGLVFYENREAQRVDLRRRNNANSPVGIYRCGIPTSADPSVRATVYVGLYTASGGIYNI